jgi:hypothetical protein
MSAQGGAPTDAAGGAARETVADTAPGPSTQPPAAMPVVAWLVPAEPWLGRLSATIASLAGGHDAPVFEPHVTLHVGATAAPGALPGALARLAASLAPVAMTAGATAHDRPWHHTLYVELEAPGLPAMQRRVAEALAAPGDYALAPHLSLLYREDLPEPVRAALAAAHRLDGARIVFDTLVLVRPQPGGDLSDVRRIDTTLRARLGAAPP